MSFPPGRGRTDLVWDGTPGGHINQALTGALIILCHILSFILGRYYTSHNIYYV